MKYILATIFCTVNIVILLIITSVYITFTQSEAYRQHQQKKSQYHTPPGDSYIIREDG